MKKYFLVLFLNIITVQGFAGGLWMHYRWRNNDGNEKTATWRAGLDTGITITDTTTIRLRILFTQTGGIRPLLYCSTNTAQSSFPQIINYSPADTGVFALTGNTKYLINGTATTSQINPNGIQQSYSPGRIITIVDADSIANSDINAEVEWSIRPTKNVKPATTYYFYCNNPFGNDGIYGGPYYAVLTTSNDILHPGDKITSYNLSLSGNEVTLNFNTAVAGHDHFELQYSKNGVTWLTYKILPGDNLHVHQTTFPKPPQGQYYARIALYDVQNNMSVSPIIKKVIDSSGNVHDFILRPENTIAAQPAETTFKVYPNPASPNVSFDLKNYKGSTFTATVTDLYGKQLGKQTITVNAEGHYAIQTNTSPGTYILNIKGNNLAKASRVMVQ